MYEVSRIPMIMHNTAITWPGIDVGVTSPYPTVDMVVKAQYMPSKISSNPRSKKNALVPKNIAQRTIYSNTMKMLTEAVLMV